MALCRTGPSKPGRRAGAAHQGGGARSERAVSRNPVIRPVTRAGRRGLAGDEVQHGQRQQASGQGAGEQAKRASAPDPRRKLPNEAAHPYRPVPRLRGLDRVLGHGRPRAVAHRSAPGPRTKVAAPPVRVAVG